MVHTGKAAPEHAPLVTAIAQSLKSDSNSLRISSAARNAKTASFSCDHGGRPNTISSDVPLSSVTICRSVPS